jgi:hypothetical protein
MPQVAAHALTGIKLVGNSLSSLFRSAGEWPTMRL